jgi:nucleotide-binding universal stress UspA family protein
VASLDDHQARLEAMAAGLEDHGFAVEAVASAGKTAVEVLRNAGDARAGLVVVGSRSRNRTRDAFIGSTAWEIVQRSTVPVLVLPIGAEGDRSVAKPVVRCFEPERPILFATDFSETADRAFALLLTIAREVPTRFTLLHVLDRRENAYGRDDERLTRLADRLLEAGSQQVRVELARGEPAMEVVRRAGEGGAGLVVMGTRGRTLTTEILLGSVSRQVLRASAGPLLLVPR